MPEAAVAAPLEHVVRDATGLLERAGCETPRLDAELLIAEALGVGRERMILDVADELQPEALARIDALIARRRRREPVAYILGRKQFRNIPLSVDPRVLIPRPETELLVEVGLSLDRGARVVDVGTGSGAVALALKDERPDLDVWGTELDADALTVARDNARRLGREVKFVKADLLNGLPGPIDAVLANLPYVAAGSKLPPEIASYEPRQALFAGQDGLDAIRRLVAAADQIPLVALEVGFGQASSVAALVGASRSRHTEVLRDLAGHERVVIGRL